MQNINISETKENCSKKNKYDNVDEQANSEGKFLGLSACRPWRFRDWRKGGRKDWAQGRWVVFRWRLATHVSPMAYAGTRNKTLTKNLLAASFFKTFDFSHLSFAAFKFKRRGSESPAAWIRLAWKSDLGWVFQSGRAPTVDKDCDWGCWLKVLICSYPPSACCPVQMRDKSMDC